VSGLRIHYRSWAPEGEPVGKVLLLHGIGGSTYSFNQVAPELVEAGFAVLALDLPGFGYSDPALRFEHTAANRLAVIWTLIDRLDTDDNEFNPLRRWLIVGHQMGGEFGAWMAIDRPGRVAGLVMISTVLGDNRPAGRLAGFPPVRWAFRSWMTTTLFTVDGVRELLEDAYAQAPTEDDVDAYLAPVLRPDADRAIINYTKTVGNESPDPARIQAPVLLVWGSEDSWRSLEEGTVQAEQIPNAELRIIDGAGHVPMDTHPQELARIVIPWIESVVSSGG
jgi:pimeloyl-ACP methyl ester carboxylesterase